MSPNIKRNPSLTNEIGNFVENDLADDLQDFNTQGNDLDNYSYGYTLLQQDLEDDFNTYSHEERNQSDLFENDYCNIESNDLPINNDLQFNNYQSSLSLNEDNIDQIKKCMSNFTLPTTSFPKWALSIPEETLSKFIYDKLEANKNN